jgi:Zn ribbon nucleic-acid-binding protein
MIRIRACPRCDGAILEHRPSDVEDAMCINCGWRRQDIPDDVQQEVVAHRDKAYVEDRYVRERIGTGKPPLSGWDRKKRLRERVRGRLSSIATTLRPT